MYENEPEIENTPKQDGSRKRGRQLNSLSRTIGKSEVNIKNFILKNSTMPGDTTKGQKTEAVAASIPGGKNRSKHQNVKSPPSLDKEADDLKKLCATEAPDREILSGIVNLLASMRQEHSQQIVGLHEKIVNEEKKYRDQTKRDIEKFQKQWRQDFDKLEKRCKDLESKESDSSKLQEKLEVTDKLVEQLKTQTHRTNTVMNNFETQSRKRNIVISGLNINSETEVRSGVESFLKQRFGLEEVVEETERMGKVSIKVTLSSDKIKSNIMSEKKKLKGTKIFIRNDLSPQDNNIAKILREIATDQRAENRKSVAVETRLYTDEGNFTWDVVLETLVPLTEKKNREKKTPRKKEDDEENKSQMEEEKNSE